MGFPPQVLRDLRLGSGTETASEAKEAWALQQEAFFSCLDAAKTESTAVEAARRGRATRAPRARKAASDQLQALDHALTLLTGKGLEAFTPRRQRQPCPQPTTASSLSSTWTKAQWATAVSGTWPTRPVSVAWPSATSTTESGTMSSWLWATPPCSG